MKLIRTLILTGLLGLIALLGAAPLSMTPVQVTQPDGTELNIFASGDEFHNWLHDADRYTIVQNDAGYYVYAQQDGDALAPTELMVGVDNPAQFRLTPGINLGPSLVRAKYDRYPGMRDYSDAKSPHTGDFNNLVVFIRFADDPEFVTPLGAYEDIFNLADGNSMKRYFWEASYNQLTLNSTFYPIPDGQTIVSYVDIYSRSYYQAYSASNPKGYQGDGERTEREHNLLLRAVNAIAPQVPPTLVIDGDNDGYVDNTCFIIKGSTEGWAELLWPHRWVLYTVNAMIHGKRVWDFNFQIETSTLGEGASVLAHEMFHSLGAPDLYRYSDTTIDPIGSWDLMCANANPPQNMSAWMKYRYGDWLPAVTDITQSGTYSLSPVAGSATNNIYRVPSWRTNEYYVLEYRQPTAHYDANLPGHGLLVYRLNMNESGNAQGPPDELYLYRPYGTSNTVNGMLSQAHFSANVGRTELSEATVPNGFMSNNSPGGLNLFDIGEAGETISFKIKISDIQLTYPHGGETWFSGSNKTITWKSKASSGTVTVAYSLDGGNQWTTLVSGASVNGNYTWMNIPSLNAANAYIRVTLNSNGHTDSNYYPFTILSEMAVPQGTYPANQAVNIPTNPLLTWSAVPGVTGYQFQVSDNENYDGYLVNLIDHPANSYQLSGLTPYHTYYWRVCSISEIGIGPFCESLSFTTGNLTEIPSAPALLTPPQMATGQPLDVNFSWEGVSLASNYNLQLALDPWFAPALFTAQNITGTSYLMEGLELGTTYYWRVCSSNVAGCSNFSQIWHFTTLEPVANDDPTAPVAVTALEQNYPNPFRSGTAIPLSLKDPGSAARLEIFNLKGQLVRTLYDGVPAKQKLELVWDGKDDRGNSAGNGIYYYRMTAGESIITRKMLLMK